MTQEQEQAWRLEWEVDLNQKLEARVEELEASLRELSDWMREHTSPVHDAGTLEMLLRAHKALHGDEGDGR